MELLTMQQLCDKYHYSKATIVASFPRTQKAIYKKYGIKIRKKRVGNEVKFYEEVQDDKIFNDIYQKTREEINSDYGSRDDADFEFTIFIALMTSPFFVYRGTYMNFLKYMNISVNEDNTRMLKYNLQTLSEKDLISVIYDEDDFFIAFIKRKTETELRINANMIRECKRLAKRYDVRKWADLLRVWIGIQMFEDEQSFDINVLSARTGVKKDRIENMIAVLKKSADFALTPAAMRFKNDFRTFI